MSFCCAAESQFGPKVAERDLRRYRRRGADTVTKLILAQLRRWPLQDKRLLNIGGGIGVISAELAADGIASATLVEASPAYLEVARQELQSRYGSRSTQFLLGDFARIADTLPDADVITLDRVVCCYPDAEGLLRGAASRTLQLLAVSYPRDRWYMRTATAVQNFLRWMNRANGIRSKIFKIAAPPHFPGPQGANPWTIDPKPTGIHRARARAFVLLPFRTCRSAWQSL